MPETPRQTHTPGPWQVEVSTDAWGFINYTVNGRGAATAREANAALIAAAPDLLAALKALTQDSRFSLAIGGNPHAVDALVKQVDEAIRKAEGDQP